MRLSGPAVCPAVLTTAHESCTMPMDVKKRRFSLAIKRVVTNDSFFIRMQENERLFAELEPLLAGAGLALVELSASRRGGSATVRTTVYKAAGTGTDECAAAHRLMYPRLQILLGTESLSLEVASPGIDRSLRTAREWRVFAGRSVKVLLKDGGDWIRGKIAECDGEKVVLACRNGARSVALAAVAKARLDSSQEGD